MSESRFFSSRSVGIGIAPHERTGEQYSIKEDRRSCDGVVTSITGSNAFGGEVLARNRSTGSYPNSFGRGVPRIRRAAFFLVFLRRT